MIELRQFASVGRSLVATQDFRAGEIVLSDCAVIRWSGDAELPADVEAAVKPFNVPTFLIAAVHAFASKLSSPAVVRAVMEMHVPDLPIGRSSADLYRACDAYIQAFPAVGTSIASSPARTLGMKAANGDPASVLAFAAMAAKVNSHRAANGDWCLFSTASKLAHSCDPNLFFLPPNAAGECSFVATRTILTGQLLSFSYLGGPSLMSSTGLRQKRLQASHLFVCQCARCVGPDLSRQLRCPRQCGSHHYSSGIATISRGEHEPPLLRRKGSDISHTDSDAFPGKPWTCGSCGQGLDDQELRGTLMEESRICDAVDAINPSGYKLEALRDLALDAVSELGYGHHAYAATAQHLMAYFRIMVASGAKEAVPVFMCWTARFLDALVLQGVESPSAEAFPHMLAASAVQAAVSVVVGSGEAGAQWIPAVTAMAKEVSPFFAAANPTDKRTQALAAFARTPLPDPYRAPSAHARCSRVTRALVQFWPNEYCAHIGLQADASSGSGTPSMASSMLGSGNSGTTRGRAGHGLVQLLDLWEHIVATKQVRQSLA